MYDANFNINISNSGKMRIQGRETFDKLLKDNKGKRGVINISIYDERDPKQIIKYYFAYIVPEFRKWYKKEEGLHLTPDMVNERLMSISAITRYSDHKSIYKLDVMEIWYYLEDIKKVAAENFNLYLI